MLRKLIGHEFKATSKTFLPLYGALVLLTLLTKLLDMLHLTNSHSIFINLPANLITLLWGLLLVSLLLVTYCLCLSRFSRNLFGDEGYLSFTLPVSKEAHLAAKLTTSLVWCMLSGVLLVVAILVLGLNRESIEIFFGPTFRAFWSEIFSMGFTPWLMLLTWFLVLLSVTATMLLYAYTSICGGHLLGNRRGAAALSAVVLLIGTQVISNLVSRLLHFCGLTGEALGRWLATLGNGPSGDPFLFSSAIGFSVILCTMAVNLVLFFLCRYVLNRRLNLS